MSVHTACIVCSGWEHTIFALAVSNFYKTGNIFFNFCNQLFYIILIVFFMCHYPYH